MATAKKQLEAYLNESICDDGDHEAKAKFALAAMDFFEIFSDGVMSSMQNEDGEDTVDSNITLDLYTETLKTFNDAEIRALREKSNIPDAAK